MSAAASAEATHSQYDTLRWTEEEVEAVLKKRVNLDKDPWMRAQLARLPKEREAYIISRHSAVDQLVWCKFTDKLINRDLMARWYDETEVPPNTKSEERPDYQQASIAWMKKNAPDLEDECKAHYEWQRDRNKEWNRTWQQMLEEDEKKKQGSDSEPAVKE